MLLKNKTVVITGCNRGIGFAILKTFLINGANVIACTRKNNKKLKNDLEKLFPKYVKRVKFVNFDLEKEEEIIKGFNSIKKIAQSIDIIINNAGVNQASLFQMTSVEKAKSVFNTNFFSVFSLTQKLLKILKKNSYSKIINISSNAAELCSVGRSVYAPSKAAVIAFTKVLSKELGTNKICVNAIAPGLVDTDMKNETPIKIVEDVIQNTALKKIATPKDISKTALFLASDESNHISGETIFITGGFS